MEALFNLLQCLLLSKSVLCLWLGCLSYENYLFRCLPCKRSKCTSKAVPLTGISVYYPVHWLWLQAFRSLLQCCESSLQILDRKNDEIELLKSLHKSKQNEAEETIRKLEKKGDFFFSLWLVFILFIQFCMVMLYYILSVSLLGTSVLSLFVCRSCPCFSFRLERLVWLPLLVVQLPNQIFQETV